VALGPLDGPTVRDLLRTGNRGVSGATILAALDRLTTGEGDDARSSVAVDAAHHARSIAAYLPSEVARLAHLVHWLGEDAPQPVVPVHGDLHPAQLVTDGEGTLTGLLDLDTVALGARVDDLATYAGHLATIAITSPHRAGIEGHGAAVLAAFDRAVDPVALRRRTAAVAIGLATGPHRVQERGWKAATRARLALAERWLDSAERLAGA